MNDQLSKQLSQLESERTLLQERLRVAVQESEGLKQTQSKHQEISAALSERALKAEASLEALVKLKEAPEEPQEDQV